jgi:transcriptional regulator with XRE-family HTH domain
MDIKKQVGFNIKKIRDVRAISQEQLALESGVHRTYISGLERGVRNPTVTIIQSLAVALQVTASDLLREK